MKKSGAARLLLVGLAALGLLAGCATATVSVTAVPTASPSTTPVATVTVAPTATVNPTTTPGPSPTATVQPSAPPPASPTAGPSCPPPETYVVRSGDTLSGIASRHGVTLQALLAANPRIIDPGLSSAGERITISPIDLGTVGHLSGGSAINDRGQIVGATDSSGAARPFLWQDGMMTDLGTLGGGGDSWANNINDLGQVVGAGYTTPSHPHSRVARCSLAGYAPQTMGCQCPVARGFHSHRAVNVAADTYA